MKALHPLAAAALAAYALCATVALSADLGRRDAAARFAADAAPVLQVYTSGAAGSPALDKKTVAAFRAISGVRAAIAVSEVSATLSGLDYAVPSTVYAIPEGELKSLRLPLLRGALPDSAWQAQALLGGALAVKLADAADRVGGTLPGTVRLSVGNGGTLDVQVSGVARPAGSVRDNGLWLDEAIAQQLLPEERRAAPLPVTRAEVEARSVEAAPAVAQALREQGYLVENPVEAQARTLKDSAAMLRQWGVLAALALVCSAWALLHKPPERLLPAVLGALCAAALGEALAVALTQTAMLLGARFFLSADARYLLDAPRLAAVGLLAVAMAAGSVTIAAWRHRSA